MKLSPLIEIDELLNIATNPEVLIVDASNSKNARANYEREHLEGALFVDLNSQLSSIKEDASNGGRHPLPLLHDFLNTLSGLGIAKDTHVVIYDNLNGSNAAARFWWMLRAVGHEKVQVLNGGWHQAKKRHFPMSSKIEEAKRVSESYTLNSWLLPTVEINQVERATQDHAYLVVDVRDQDRYLGRTEPIDLIAGHIPGAMNIPFTENLNTNGLFLQPQELQKKYNALLGTIKPEKLIVHCGSGVTACHTLLALDYAGFTIPNLYVGSWSEWSRSNKKVVTGRDS